MGRFDLQALDIADLGELRVALRDLGPLFGPRIVGAEVTQAIQYFRSHRHLTDPLDRAPDNAARIVAFKPAWVRVYVRSSFATQQLTARMKVERRRPGPLAFWQPAGDLLPLGASALGAETAPDYAVERGQLGATLNFVLPADTVRGILRLTITLYPTDATAEAPVDTEVVTIDATLLQTLSVRGLMVGYNGPNAANNGTLALAAPTVGDLAATAAWTLTTNPVQSEGVFSSAGTVNLTTPLTGPATAPGGCSPGWLTLNTLLATAKANDGNRADVVYYGLLPNGVPMGPVIGCASSGVTSGSVGDGITMAHEIGHFAGQAHAPCGTPGDPAYPAYEPYDPAGTPMASLGEYGLDINDGTIHPPAQKDYMSYCGPRWISLYTHRRLIQNEVFSPTVTDSPIRVPEWMDPWVWPWEQLIDPDPPPWWFWKDRREVYTMRPVIVITGTRRRDLSVQVDSVMRLDAHATASRAVPTDMVAELIGKSGQVVASAPVMRLEAHAHAGCGCGCGGAGGGDTEPPEYSFQAFVDNAEPGTGLRIRRPAANATANAREDLTVWERKPSDTAGAVTRVDVKPREADLVVAWAVKPGTRADKLPPEYSLQFSKDSGRSWNGCAAGLRKPTAVLRLADLPSGPLIFRAMLHDGFDTVRADSKPVTLSPRAPQLRILSPCHEQAFVAGMPMRLWASVSTSTGQRVDPDACLWELSDYFTDQFEKVGSGLEAFIEAPRKRDVAYRVRFTVRGDPAATAETIFWVWDGENYLQPYGITGSRAAAPRGASAGKRSAKPRKKK